MSVKSKVTYLKKVVGWLACDNVFLDRTCPQCGGMYSSVETKGVCPKCGAALVHITFLKSDGERRTMGMSQGTITEALSAEEEEKYAKQTKDAGGLLDMTRFKLFSFSDGITTLAPHDLHRRCKEGVLIEVTIINHKEINRPYRITRAESNFVKRGWLKVGDIVLEKMMLVFPSYGDSVQILGGIKSKGDVMVNEHIVTKNMPIQTPTRAPGALEKRIAEIEARLAALNNMPTLHAKTMTVNDAPTDLWEVMMGDEPPDEPDMEDHGMYDQ